MRKLQWKMDSAIGPIYLVASAAGLESVYFRRREEIELALSLEGAGPEEEILAAAARQLGEYLAGERREFDLPLHPTGTEFQRKVWDQLRRIPYGQTISYRQLARNIRNEKAMRAVGGANGKNPISIIVPCHRVIAADGGLGGYSGGLPNKARLLKLETGKDW